MRMLLDKFDVITDSAENIPVLRRLIINLAICGKLLKEPSTSESASACLKRILAERERLVAKGQIRKQNSLPPIASEEIPAGYPAHCVFERLANVAALCKGATGIQSSKPGKFPLVVTAEARSTCDHYDFDGSAAIIPMVSSSGHGDASLKRLHYQEGKFAVGNILCAVFPFSEELMSARFIYEYLTAFKEDLLVSRMIGTANVSLTLGKIGEVPIPIVSPAVQRRVDELMALCDQLVSVKSKREIQRDSLVASSFHRLNSEAGVEKLQENVRFHLRHLPRLTTRQEHIRLLRQTILNLAIRGKLVPQDPNDEPASALSSQIISEKTQAIAEPTTVAFMPPSGWKWTQAQNLCRPSSTITYGILKPVWVKDGVPTVRVQDMKDGNIVVEAVGRCAHERALKFSKTMLEPGDLLVAKDGATLGKTAFVPASLAGGNITQHVLRFPISPCVSNSFIRFVIDSPHGQAWMRTETRGVALPGVNVGDFRRMPIPLPPLAEQHRIVAKVEELMALCDKLEAQLTTTQTQIRRLLESVLHEALSV